MTRQNEISYREKGRAVFLAVIMVLSVVAMSAAFAGGAAADVESAGSPADIDVGESAASQVIDNFNVDSDDNDVVIDLEELDEAGATFTTDAVEYSLDDGSSWENADASLDAGAAEITIVEDGTHDLTDIDHIRINDIDTQGIEGASDLSYTVEQDDSVEDTDSFNLVGPTDFTATAEPELESAYAEHTVTFEAVGEISVETLTVTEEDGTYELTGAYTNVDSDDQVDVQIGDDSDIGISSITDNDDDVVINLDDDYTVEDGETVVITIEDAENPENTQNIDVAESGGSASPTWDIADAAELAVNDEVPEGDSFLTSGTSSWEGQEVWFQDNDDPSDGDYELREYDRNDDDVGSLEEQFTLDDDYSYVLDTEGLESGWYVIEHPDGHLIEFSDGLVSDTNTDPTASEFDPEFEINVQSLDAEFEADEVDDATDDFEVEFDSNRGSWDMNVSADGDKTASDLSHDELGDIFNESFDTEGHADDDILTLQDVSDGDYELNFTDVDAGGYTFDFDVTDTAASANDTVTVTEADDADYSISSAIADRGEIANISVNLEQTDEAALQVGDNEDVSFEVGLTIDASDYDGDEVVIQMNTHTAHEEDFDDVFEAYDDDVDIDVEYHNISDNEIEANANNPQTIDNPLAAGDYETTVGDFWDDITEPDTAEMNNEEDSSYLTLEERSAFGDVNTHTAPADDDVDDLEENSTVESILSNDDITVTQSELVAEGDHILMTVEDAGLTGLLDDEEGDIAGVLEDVGIYVELEEQDVAANQDPTVWNSSEDDEDLELNFVNHEDYTGDALLLEIPADPGVEIEADEDYDVTFTVDETSDYVDDDDDDVISSFETESELAHEERDLDWDNTAEYVALENNASALGESNAAPGTELDVRAQKSGVFIVDDEPEVAINDDGDRYFEALLDFADEEDAEVGQEFELSVEDDHGPEDLEEDITATLVDADEDTPATFSGDVSFDPADPEDGDDVTVTVDVTNDGEQDGTVEVVFSFDGENLIDEKVELEGDESESLSAMTGALDEGDYDWELLLDGDVEDSGTLSVSDAPDDDDTDADDGDADDITDDDADDDADDDGMPGFGVAVALVALLSAAMLALRRQD